MNTKRTTIGPDSEVILHCRLLLEDGTVAEDTTGDEPICLRMGDGTLLGRLEEKLLGLHAGEHQAWDLAPDGSIWFLAVGNGAAYRVTPGT